VPVTSDLEQCNLTSRESDTIEVDCYKSALYVIYCSHTYMCTHTHTPVECADHRTCSSCQENNADCGWCNDVSDTGLGMCVEGGFLGARNGTQCSAEQWYFDTCPGECRCMAASDM